MNPASIAVATLASIARSSPIGRLVASATAGMLAALMSSTAHAGFMGMTLDAYYGYSDIGSPYSYANVSPSTFTVSDPGIETVAKVEDVTTLTVDFSDNWVRIDFSTLLNRPTWNNGPFNGLVFNTTALNVFDFTSVSIDPMSTLPGFGVSRVVLGPERLALNWAGLSYVNGTVLQINFDGVNSVPEPGTLGLIGAFLGLLAVSKRRRVQA